MINAFTSFEYEIVAKPIRMPTVCPYKWVLVYIHVFSSSKCNDHQSCYIPLRSLILGRTCCCTMLGMYAAIYNVQCYFLYVPKMCRHISIYKPVGERDHEVLGMGSFGEYKLFGN
jgi:hypothetical protein